ncbi:neural cell adhesion molecule L1.2 isoform X1 [Synchiropus splendidus]|uniref:neural cell adhesion molecule L1.2 isoform X1 n=1 Tax=Synchiropus splendidus TaxID=270530 RepID=UPI00237E33C2|nr:neural cell adhesion molecule L1.2 isoform X1 [Synchiropus splendidus]
MGPLWSPLPRRPGQRRRDPQDGQAPRGRGFSISAAAGRSQEPEESSSDRPAADYNDEIRRPPTILTQPESVTVFSVEDLVMRCEASGSPPPIFRWSKDGEEFDPSNDTELKVSESPSTFAFYTLSNTMEPLKKYQGTYTCFASNDLGTAVSADAVLRIEVPPSQQKEKKMQVMEAEEGRSLVLNCNPPQSSMEPIIHWMDQSLHHIQLSERVMAGRDGNLYFANLEPKDSRNDYTCNVQYLATRTILAKEPISLTVTRSNSVLRNRRPHMMRPSGAHSTYQALRGQTLELECIVQGLPTPKVSWLQKDGEMSESRTSRRMSDRRLLFTNISEADTGEYQCIASNSQGKITHTYSVFVEAAPYWTKEPKSQLYAPGETVRLDCQADGIPTPVISWTINGVPLSSTAKEPRRTLTSGGSLILNDVNYGDTAVFQCRASNRHGAIVTNAVVHVIKIPPQILTDDAITYTFIEGSDALLECDNFGSPKPKVTWVSSSTSSLLADSRFNLLTSGGLEIWNVSREDVGLYTCSLQKTSLFISAELQVLNRTVILSPAQALRVQREESAVFTCLAVADLKLDPPQIQWRKNNQKLFVKRNDEKYQMEGPNLIVVNTTPEDEGLYTCQAITNMDKAEVNNTLIVYDRPDPPSALQISESKHRRLTLSWTPGDDHQSPVQEFLVEFETQEAKDGEWEELKRVGGGSPSTSLSLWPFMSYRFRVTAINEAGKSAPSRPSDLHRVAAEAPDMNPADVRSESTDPDTLLITWEEMDQRNFNGPDFMYRVMWRRVLGEGPDWHSNYTTAPPLLVTGTGNFSAFEIKVQAVNRKGDGPDLDPVIGYSGEDVPLEAPMDVAVEMLNSTAIEVTWAAVDQSTVRGRLLGYKIHLTRVGTRGHLRGRRAREPTLTVLTGAGEQKKVIANLRPYSRYKLAVNVFNSKGDGPPCETLGFDTEEGAPGPPDSLTLESPSESEMTLRWSPPSQPNGILLGYELQYQRISESDNSPTQVENIHDPAVSHLSLKGLDRHSHYRFYLRGRTAAGYGEAAVKEGATTLEGAPPANISVSVGENYANFSWTSKKRHRSVHFQIHYLRKSAPGDWRTVDKVNSAHSFYQLQGLVPGSHYHLRFTYSNKTFWDSDVQIEGSGVREVQQGFATKGWFIGVVSAVVLLLLVLLILCFIRRGKGGKYSVKDKEEGPMDSEARPMKDETFGEYRSLERYAVILFLFFPLSHRCHRQPVERLLFRTQTWAELSAPSLSQAVPHTLPCSLTLPLLLCGEAFQNTKAAAKLENVPVNGDVICDAKLFFSCGCSLEL